MRWLTRQDLIRDLGLESNQDDDKALLNEMSQRRQAIHPDKNGGNFKSDSDRDEYVKLNDAIDLIRKGMPEEKALTLVNNLPALFEAMNKAITSKSSETVRNEALALSRTERKTRYLVPRIGSGAVVAASGYVINIAKTLADDPILAPIVATSCFKLTILIIGIYASVFFLWTWISEQQEDKFLDRAMSEDGMHHFLVELIQDTPELLSGGRTYFTKRELSRVILNSNRARSRFKFPFVSRGISVSTSEAIATTHISMLQECNALRSLPTPGLHTKYELTPEVLSELLREAK